VKNWFLWAVAVSAVACGPLETDGLQPDGALAPPQAGPEQAVEVGKPVPVRPPLEPNVMMGNELPPKPAHSLGMAPALTWTVSLTASPNYLWPTQYATLTATANQDVGPTPYYIRIWDGQAGVYLASCGTGKTCTATVTRPQITFTSFAAVIEDSSGYGQASTYNHDVYWHGVELALSASPTTVAVGGTTTLTATANQDVGPSPFYIEIFDTTTGTFVKSCGSGTSCSVPVSQATAGTHAYQAFLMPYGTAYPPAAVQETTSTSYVTWGTSGYSISLYADSSTYSTATVTATASINVGPTAYYIQIFSENGTRIAICGSGTTCTTQYAPTGAGGGTLVAFISANSTTLPPLNAQASSNLATTYLIIPPK
jgi:hypothetical protein